MRQYAAILKWLSPEADSQAAWQELQNKLEAFSLFQQVDIELNISPEAPSSFPELVERVRQFDRYRGIWLMEGLGHCHSDLLLRQGYIPGNILKAPSNGRLPAASLIPLHAGMGLSLAEWLLPAMERNPTQGVRTFIEACQAASQPGYFGVACEALGLATRNLFPHLLAPLDLALSRAGEAYLEYFWHGIGRAIYFSPANLPPWRTAPWAGFETCLRESTHNPVRRNAVAGFCWALTLINIRHPEVLEAFLKCHEHEITAHDACRNGIASALLIGAEATGDASCLDALQQHQPAASAVSLWRTHVLPGCEAARLHSGSSQLAMDELFRCQDMDAETHFSMNSGVHPNVEPRKGSQC